MNLKYMSPKAHALCQYSLSLTQLIVPRVLRIGWLGRKAHTALACVTAACAATTDQPLSGVKEIPLDTALRVDAICGGVVLAGAAISRDRPLVRWVMAGVGLSYLCAAFCTRTTPLRKVSPRPATLRPGESPMQRYARETAPEAATSGAF